MTTQTYYLITKTEGEFAVEETSIFEAERKAEQRFGTGQVRVYTKFEYEFEYQPSERR